VFFSLDFAKSNEYSLFLAILDVAFNAFSRSFFIKMEWIVAEGFFWVDLDSKSGCQIVRNIADAAS